MGSFWAGTKAWLLGSAVLLTSSALAYAYPTHHIVTRRVEPHHPIVHHVVDHRAPIRHAPVHHVVLHRAPIHHAPIHHVVIRHAPVHTVVRHEVIARHVVTHHPVHRPEIHHPIRRAEYHRVEPHHPPVHVAYRHEERIAPHHIAPHRIITHRVEVAHRGPVHHEVSRWHRAAYLHPVHYRPFHYAPRWHGISCVPYAREVSGIHVAGNAWQWWDNAKGHYARGQRPEVGSVLDFRANGRMRLGHVAVVARVVNRREVLVDQANWPSGGAGGGDISKNIAIVDVSEANNWSAVRVELGHSGSFGSVYPTYGFIYNRPDQGVVMASVNRPAPLPHINPTPSDLRPKAERPWQTTVQVAEEPSKPLHRIDLNINHITDVK